MTERPEVDMFKVLENIMLRPSMFFGRKSISAFWHYYHGLVHLGDDRMGYRLFKVKNCLLSRDGFFPWICKRRGWVRNVVPQQHYLTLAQERCRHNGVEEPSRIMQESVGFDLFARDLGEFRDLPPCVSYCRVGYPHDGECISMEGR